MKYIVTVKAETDLEIEAESEIQAKIKALSKVNTDDFGYVITCVTEAEDE